MNAPFDRDQSMQVMRYDAERIVDEMIQAKMDRTIYQLISKRVNELREEVMDYVDGRWNDAQKPSGEVRYFGGSLVHGRMDSSSIDFLQSGTGATGTTAQDELRRWVWVEQFGAVGDGTSDDSAAIQKAINTGALQILFGPKTYRASGLTQSTAFQSFVCPNGIAIVKKNANGVLFSSTGDNVTLENISFKGDAASPTFTGDNINATGANFSMLNCGSRWTSGRAVKSTGGHTQIIGTCDIYQTTDATSTGYDIELGVSGTATLYHQLYGVYSSQATGGILATDTGSLVVLGGQFGKLNIASGTSPAGVNGGHVSGARILGNVTIGISNSTWTCNHFGSSVGITISSNISGVSIDESNSFDTGATVTNNGIGANYIARNTGNSGVMVVKFGDDTASPTMTIDHTSPGDFKFTQVTVPNNIAYRMLASGGGVGGSLTVSAADNLTLSNITSGKAIVYITQGNTTGDRHIFAVNNGTNVLWVAPLVGTQAQASRMQNAQGAAVASANNLVLGNDGNRFQISGTTQVNLIANTNWQGGAIVTLHFQGIVTVKHNQTASGANVPIMLSGSVDFVSAANGRLVLQYDSTDTKWYEIGRTVA